MKKKKFLTFCLFGGLSVLTVFAAETDSVAKSLSLSLSDAQTFALEHNRSLKNATLDVQKSEAARWQTIATMLPQVNAKLDYQNMCGYEMAFGPTPIALNPTGMLGVTAGLALSGEQVVGAMLGAIAERMSDISLKKSEQVISDQVKAIYYSTLVLNETVQLLNENLANMQKLLNSTQAAVDAGVAEQVDADKLAVQVATMETQINSIERSVEMSYNSLRLQLGATVDTELVLTQTMDDLLNIDTAFALLSDEFILDNNYDYQLLKENIALSKKQVLMKEWAFGPQVTAFYQYSYKTYFGKSEGFNMTPPNMVGVSLNVPIFSSGMRLKGVKEAKLAYQQQQNTLADTEDALKVQHRQLTYNLSSSYENFEIQKENIEVIKRVFANISEKYDQGMASSLEVTNSSTELISAQSSYVQALLEFVNAQIALEQLLNK